MAFIVELDRFVDVLSDSNLLKLKEYLKEKSDDYMEKHQIPLYASRLMLFYEEKGLEELKKSFYDAPGSIYPLAILQTIFYASQKQLVPAMPVLMKEDDLKKPVITDRLASEADVKFREILRDALTNPDVFERILQFFNREVSFFPEHLYDANKFTEIILGYFRDLTININKKVIEDFENMVKDEGLREEAYQNYIKSNPVLIDPIAKEVIPKQKLGIEFITDFAIRKLDDEYLLVEIEKPTTPIFTANNDFSASFTHALGQIIDFQEWVEANIAYAQTLMPKIISPYGLLIIGLRSKLSEVQIRKLNRFNINNKSSLKVVTFDDLVEGAYKLYSNVIS